MRYVQGPIAVTQQGRVHNGAFLTPKIMPLTLPAPQPRSYCLGMGREAMQHIPEVADLL